MEGPSSNLNLHNLMVLKGKLIRTPRRRVLQTTENQRAFYLVKSGYVKRYLITKDGSLSTDIIYGPGDVFSLTLIFRALYDRQILESPEVYFYEAMTPEAQLFSLTVDDLKKYIAENPLLYKDLLSEAGKRMTYETHGLENMAMKSAYNRVAHRLVYYAHHFGESKGDGVILKIPLTHQDIADILNLTRETVSVSINRLRKKGFIVMKNRYIVIKDVDKLNDEAFS